jgi:hypothetical protein
VPDKTHFKGITLKKQANALMQTTLQVTQMAVLATQGPDRSQVLRLAMGAERHLA